MRAYPAELIAAQQEAIFAAWCMSPEHLDACSRAMLYADLRGIDSHGIAMLPIYAAWRDEGRISTAADVRIVHKEGGLGLIDADHGLGHPASEMAIRLAVETARKTGVAAVGVCRSNHFGAAGYYTHLASQAGMFAIACSGTPGRTVVPPLAREPRLGALPMSFAAPSRRGEPVMLDFAISTVAMGKINLARIAGKPIPQGWAVDMEGKPLTDSEEAFRIKRLTPVGGHKGYGLGAMVESLASVATGSFLGGFNLETGERGQYLEIGHFFIVMDLGSLRGEGSSSVDVAMDRFADMLRSTQPIDPNVPVMAPGDPERGIMGQRTRAGIPLLPKLVDDIRELAAKSGAPFLLES